MMTLPATEPTGIMSDLCERPELAREIRVHPRTIARYERFGLPVIRVGKRPLYHPPSVRAWILARQVSAGNEPPRRGRPPKAGRV